MKAKKKKPEKYEELSTKIRDLIRSITKNSDEYQENYIQIKFNSDDELPLNKTIQISSMAIVVRAIFLESNKYHPQYFLEKWRVKKNLKK